MGRLRCRCRRLGVRNRDGCGDRLGYCRSRGRFTRISHCVGRAFDPELRLRASFAAIAAIASAAAAPTAIAFAVFGTFGCSHPFGVGQGRRLTVHDGAFVGAGLQFCARLGSRVSVGCRCT